MKRWRVPWARETQMTKMMRKSSRMKITCRMKKRKRRMMMMEKTVMMMMKVRMKISYHMAIRKV